MNFYNPYYYTFPTMVSPAATGLGRLVSGFRNFNFGNIINGAGKTLNLINQAIPIIKEARPVMKNAKTMLKIANEFKKVDTTIKPKAEVAESNNLNNTSENEGGPTFFLKQS